MLHGYVHQKVRNKACSIQFASIFTLCAIYIVLNEILLSYPAYIPELLLASSIKIIPHLRLPFRYHYCPWVYSFGPRSRPGLEALLRGRSAGWLIIKRLSFAPLVLLLNPKCYSVQNAAQGMPIQCAHCCSRFEMSIPSRGVVSLR